MVRIGAIPAFAASVFLVFLVTHRLRSSEVTGIVPTAPFPENPDTPLYSGARPGTRPVYFVIPSLRENEKPNFEGMTYSGSGRSLDDGGFVMVWAIQVPEVASRYARPGDVLVVRSKYLSLHFGVDIWHASYGRYDLQRGAESRTFSEPDNTKDAGMTLGIILGPLILWAFAALVSALCRSGKR